MTTTNQKSDDSRMGKIIGNLLRFGVLIASVIVLTGGTFYLFRHGKEYPHYRKFAAGSQATSIISNSFADALHGKGRSIILLGLLVLVATPIMRIAASVIGYLLEKDYLYLLLTLAVLAIVISGFWS
ncbi:MAG: DUF1634 domain-containing protein [Bacteroidota bacterium]|nr:DUF1634 domain-containing protein [Bacteroidota bacterium]MDP4217805.1 DUF1634 domain-containing protein [Bacteroidota bacterium]MDP4247133.1 DUF1634 domain-containing protein [Bacteroidota bacterium]MDP4252373.1 DUF1634 domain-containing protein [Bacteroidota bacterium]MDP4257930.1 DUF1634 domain-containing protein [Bacteroidota bacterium]